MKSKLLLILIFLVLLSSLIPVFAGDVPESAMSYADYCFIGTIQEVGNDSITFGINEVVFGDYEKQTIEILRFEYVKGNLRGVNPAIGDYCAVVVVGTGNGYEVYEYLVAKADSLDKETLKLDSSNEFIVRMNSYINSGWYSNENFYNVNTKARDRIDNNNSDIKDDTELEETELGETVREEDLEIDTLKNRSDYFANLRYGLIVVIVILLVVVIIVFIYNETKRSTPPV